MHANKYELVRIFKQAGMSTSRILKSIEKLQDLAYRVQRAVGRKYMKTFPETCQKDFNIEVQAEFMAVKNEKAKYELLNSVDCDTGFGELTIVASRDARTMMIKFE